MMCQTKCLQEGFTPYCITWPGGRIVRKDGEEDNMVVSAAETPI